MSSSYSLETIVDTLDRQRQRATYGAVAGLVGTSPRVVMIGRPRDPRHSWVVSRESGRPNGYKPEQVHPELETRRDVLLTKDALAAWLQVATQ